MIEILSAATELIENSIDMRIGIHTVSQTSFISTHFFENNLDSKTTSLIYFQG